MRHLKHRRLRRLAAVATGGVLALAPAAVPALAATTGGDTAVSVDQPYVKANGKPVTKGDAIALCGTNRRQQNEPSTAIDPRNPQVVVSSSNDYCTVEGAGGTWTGNYRSTDGGQSWTDSLVPGYPTDSSAEGKASPLQQQGISNAGDPVQAWDADGRLFFMGNAFNRSKPQLGSVWIASYDQDGSHYEQTRIVGQGTPAVNGRFNDKTAIGVDRGLKSPYSGNVYGAWSVFQGQGNNSIQFTRSTDHGKTFSNSTKISATVKDSQFADIAVTSDGTVYVTWRQFESGNAGNSKGNGKATGQNANAVVFVKSTDGGKSFTKPAVVTPFASFDAADAAGDPAAAAKAHDQAFLAADGPGSEASVGDSRDCGSGPFACASGFTFFRHDSGPRSTADPSGDPNTFYVVYDASKAGTVVKSTSTYNTAPAAADGTRQVAQGAIYFTKTTNGGRTWSDPKVVSDNGTGHQWFPDIDADGGYLHLVWSDSRLDSGYSVQRPPGNAAATDAFGFHLATPGRDTYVTSSTDGGRTFADASRASSETTQPNYEMFGGKRVPFQGDYNYVSAHGAAAYNVWTDNREVKPGDDPRYDGGEGFDVLQCGTDTGADTCPNDGGLDQDIYGAATTSP